MRLATTLALVATAASTALAASVCNGDASLCQRLYSNVTYIGTHNSYAVGGSVAANQYKDVTAQLNDGVRALQVQAHKTDTGTHLCHSSCMLLDGGSLQDYLKKVGTWLGSNPNEVVTLVIVNSDNQPASTFAADFQATGLDKKAYTPKAASTLQGDWPTLGTLIDAGTQLVVFLSTTADFSSSPYLIDEFSNMWEDAYDVTDQTWGCAVNRTADGSQTNSMMYMINHFLDKSYGGLGTPIFLPDTDKLNVTNAATGDGSIAFHVDNCLMLHGRNPSVILLDYYDTTGNAPFEAAAKLNGVAAPTNQVTPAAKPSSTGLLGGGGSASATATGSDAKISSSSLNGAERTLGFGTAVVAVAGVLAGALLV